MIGWNYLIYQAIKQDADALNIKVNQYLDEYFNAEVKNGSWIVFYCDKKETLFGLKYSDSIMTDQELTTYQKNLLGDIKHEDGSDNA